MIRSLTLPTLALLLAGGCVEFSGEKQNLGFSSNLQLGPLTPWSPRHAVASGAPATFKAEWDLRTEEEPSVTATVVGARVLAAAENTVTLFFGNRGGAHVRFAGSTEDRFRVRAVPPVHVELVDPLGGGAEEDAGRWCLYPDAEVSLATQLYSVDGALLGHDPAAIDVFAEGALSAWTADGQVFLAGESGRVTVAYGKAEVETWEICTAVPVALEVDWVFEDEGVSLRATGRTDDGTRVLGIPVEWTWTDGEEREEGMEREDLLALTSAGVPVRVTASVDGVEASVTVPEREGR